MFVTVLFLLLSAARAEMATMGTFIWESIIEMSASRPIRSLTMTRMPTS